RVAFSLERQLFLLDGRTLEHCRPPADLGVGETAFAPGGRGAAISRGKRLLLVDTDTGRELRTLAVPDAECADNANLTHLAFSRGGAVLATASEWSRHVRLWDVARGRLATDLVAGAGGSMRLAFRPGGRTLAVVADRRVLLCDLTGSGVQSVAA